jgi:peptidyl-prolyl cis-trans isomerase SDCCAG10
MASDKKDQNMSQFFFTLGPAPELSGKHTLFGKVTGKTIFNLTKLNEYEVDKNERPSYVHKITGAKILENPFNDIKPRKLAEERKRKREREEREKPKKSAVPAKKNTALLSFGDEMDEEEEQISHLKLKGKSAHDVLDDEFLSRQAAVEPEELGAKGPEFEEAKVEEDLGEREQRLGRIKEKFSKPKTSKRAKFDDLDDEDLDQMQDDQKEAEKKQQM